jgi:hypothetical protein
MADLLQSTIQHSPKSFQKPLEISVRTAGNPTKIRNICPLVEPLDKSRRKLQDNIMKHSLEKYNII